MGLTNQSTGLHAKDDMLSVKRAAPDDKIIALAGNPNVGKSTVFNSLTGLKQHTGNWPGKTVTNAQGTYRHKEETYSLVDLPGTYSLMANSAEEEAARDFLCFGGADVTVVVTDATCLERNLNLVLQTLEITQSVVVCVNLIDEAKHKKIRIDLGLLSEQLKVPVVATDARKKKGLRVLTDEICKAAHTASENAYPIIYDAPIEQAVRIIELTIEKLVPSGFNSRWIALKLLDGDETLLHAFNRHFGVDLTSITAVSEAINQAKQLLCAAGIGPDALRDHIVSRLIKTAESISALCVKYENEAYNLTDRKIDRVLTSKTIGLPIMLALLGFIFWLTIAGTNVPSAFLSDGLFWVQDQLTALFHWLGAPDWLHGAFVLGIYRTMAWVVSVMLPPMAIFFPLFTLLEDLGYLPRIAFNLDKYFKKACACGKQALTMCMGFGCNAAGVVGCRIIESPRERLIATITNNFVPCNGRFPPPSLLQENNSLGLTTQKTWLSFQLSLNATPALDKL